MLLYALRKREHCSPRSVPQWSISETHNFRQTTPKALSSLTPFSMSFARRPREPTRCKVSWQTLLLHVTVTSLLSCD